MNEQVINEIDKEYERIIGQIRGGKIYGYPIDLNDRKMVVVAAWILGYMEPPIIDYADLILRPWNDRQL